MFRSLLIAAVWLGVTPLMVLPASAQNWELVWSDEFDGTSLDPSKWEPQIGTGCPNLCGWGNNELQYYRAENATVAGGMLTITAKEESFGGQAYTSARVRTKNLGDWKRGRFEMRARMPVGQGLWPAFWMLPSEEAYGGWAASGEIDILEYLGNDTDRAFGTLHYGGSFPDNVYTSNSYVLPSGDFYDSFHIFALEWDECEMRWYIDGAHYQTQRNWWSSGGSYPAPFDQPFYLLLNLAVGGYLPGPPDQSTVFPQTLVVDYVRVFQEAPNLDSCFLLFDGMEHGNPFGNGYFWFPGVASGGISANTNDVPPIEGCNVSLESGWGSGGTPGFFAGFGRNNPMDLATFTHFSMWINPDAGQSYTIELVLHDDDNGDNVVPGSPDGADDEFQYDFTVGASGADAEAGAGWQRVSIPLSSFYDDNSFHYGGNGVFDPIATSHGGNGQLINVVMVLVSPTGSDINFRTDRWGFTRNTTSIAGKVWDDTNADGVLGGGESGMNGVDVELVDMGLNRVVASQWTSGDGDYLFDTLLGGMTVVRVDTTTLPIGAMPTYDPDGTLTPGEFEVALECDQALTSRNFGYTTNPTNVPFVGQGRTVLYQNVPNPFNPRTTIAFELVRPGNVEVRVHDVTGRVVRHLLRGTLPSGLHRVDWDGRDERGNPVASGLYAYSLKTESGHWVKRMVLLK